MGAVFRKITARYRDGPRVLKLLKLAQKRQHLQFTILLAFRFVGDIAFRYRNLEIAQP
jgi:hypothetical protein